MQILQFEEERSETPISMEAMQIDMTRSVRNLQGNSVLRHLLFDDVE